MQKSCPYLFVMGREGGVVMICDLILAGPTMAGGEKAHIRPVRLAAPEQNSASSKPRAGIFPLIAVLEIERFFAFGQSPVV